MQSSSALVIIFAFLTLLVLIAGVVLMAVGGKVNKKYSNTLMRARVILQGLALAMLALLYFMAK